MQRTEVVASVIWYDEPERYLKRLIKSLEGICTHAVFVDGAYKQFPHEDPRSPASQVNAISEACEMAGITYFINNVKKSPWKDQSTKRTFALQQAAMEIDDGYILNIDADEFITKFDHEEFFNLIAYHNPDTVKVALETTDVRRSGRLGGLATQPAASSTSRTGKGVDRFYRKARDLTCGPHHHGNYSCVDSRGRYVKLRHASKKDPMKGYLPAVSLDLKHCIQITNDTWNRDDARLLLKRQYGFNRKKEGVDV